MLVEIVVVVEKLAKAWAEVRDVFLNAFFGGKVGTEVSLASITLWLLVEANKFNMSRLRALESHTEADDFHCLIRHLLVPDVLQRQPKLQLYLLEQVVKINLICVIRLDEAERFGQHRTLIDSILALILFLWIELELEEDELVKSKRDPYPIVFHHLEEVFEPKWIACSDSELDICARAICLSRGQHFSASEAERASWLNV